MGGLSCFMAENAEKRDNKKLVVSERFKDEKGLVKWEIRPIGAEEDEELRRSCTRRVPIPGKKNQYTNEFDANGYLAKLAAAAVVFPNLKDAELQDSYHVRGEEALIKAMLYKDEFDRLTEALVEDSGNELNELVADAKNSSTETMTKRR